MAKFGVIDLLSLFVTLSVYYFLDMGSDLRLAIEFYTERHYLSFWIIVGISGLGMYSLNALGCYWESRDYGLTWRSCFFFIFPYGLLYQRLRCLAILLPVVFYNNIQIKGYDIQHLILREDWKAVILALIQTFVSNAIHIVWHMRTMIYQSFAVDSIYFWTKSSMILSILSCSLALTDYHLVRRVILGTEKHTKYSLLVFLVTHVSTMCILISRFIAIAVITTSRLYGVFIAIISLHWIILLITLAKVDLNLFHDIKIKKNSDESSSIQTVTLTKTKLCMCVGSFIFSLLLLISHLETRHKKKMIFIHFFENLIFLFCWYLTTDLENIWHLWFLSGVIVTNIVGMSLCFVVWLLFLKPKVISLENELDVAVEMMPPTELSGLET